MINKIPIAVIILVIIFLITALVTFVGMEKVVSPDGTAAQAPTSTAAGIVKISIVNQNNEKEGNEGEGNIK